MDVLLIELTGLLCGKLCCGLQFQTELCAHHCIPAAHSESLTPQIEPVTPKKKSYIKHQKIRNCKNIKNPTLSHRHSQASCLHPLHLLTALCHLHPCTLHTTFHYGALRL